MALFRGIQEYIALNANNITLVFNSGNIVSISGNIYMYPPQGHLYNNSTGLKKSLVLEPGTSKISIRTSIYFHPMSHEQVKKIQCKDIYFLEYPALFGRNQ